MAAIRKRQRAASEQTHHEKEEKVAKGPVFEYTFKPREHPSLPDFKNGNFLTAFLHPLTKEEFISKYWRKMVFVAHNGGTQRLQNWVAEHLHDLDLPTLLEETPSPNIHVWMTSVTDGKAGPIESFQTDDAKIALICHNSGRASLYFRAPQAMADQVVKELSKDLGLGFAGLYPTGEVRGEIETFVSKAGHVTDWHFDFQENFSIQLRGAKRWTFVPSEIDAPIRGCTPHYKDGSTAEQQAKLHVMQQPSFQFSPVPPGLVAPPGAVSVIVNEGDCFYHPAGMWHKVEALGDSISINVSLVALSWADVVIDGLKHVLQRNVNWREGIRFDSPEMAMKQLSALLSTLPDAVQQLRTTDFLPPVRLERTTHVTIRHPLPATTLVASKARLRPNPLVVMVDLSSLPAQASADESEGDTDEEDTSGYVTGSESEEGAADKDAAEKENFYRWAMHVSFGNDDVESQTRVEFRVIAHWNLQWRAICNAINSGSALSPSDIVAQIEAQQGKSLSAKERNVMEKEVCQLASILVAKGALTLLQ